MRMENEINIDKIAMAISLRKAKVLFLLRLIDSREITAFLKYSIFSTKTLLWNYLPLSSYRRCNHQSHRYWICSQPRKFASWKCCDGEVLWHAIRFKAGAWRLWSCWRWIGPSQPRSTNVVAVDGSSRLCFLILFGRDSHAEPCVWVRHAIKLATQFWAGMSARSFNGKLL